jgi:hypothetical protein
MATKKKTEAKTDKPAKKAAKPAAGKSNGKSAAAKKTAPAKGAKTVKVAKAAKAAAVKIAGGPLAKLKAAYGSKESLVGKLVDPLAGKDEDTAALKARLLIASNKQLLRLAGVVETVTKKYGSRAKLVAAIGQAMNKAKDADYIAKLDGFSLPKLWDLAKSAERRAKA